MKKTRLQKSHATVPLSTLIAGFAQKFWKVRNKTSCKGSKGLQGQYECKEYEVWSILYVSP